MKSIETIRYENDRIVSSLKPDLHKVSAKWSAELQEKHMDKGSYVIVRTYTAGVFAGVLERRDGKEVELSDARRLWYWAGAASLSQLAATGTTRPKDCKFPAPVARIIVTEAIEIDFCSTEAEKSIREVPEWKA